MLMPTGIERNFVVLRDQPAVIPQPSAEPVWPSERTYEKTFEREAEKAKLRRPASRGSSARKNWFSGSSSSVRRLQISGPTDFRHLHSESFQFPPQESRPRPRSFRPIELSIYQPDNRLSAILPHIECNITPPPRVYTGNSSNWEASSSNTTLAHERSYSTMSFHLPRKQSRQMSDASPTPPRIPPKSRARASTAPNTERIVARIASAMLEKERLQAEINSLVERQSIYLGSRPSTGYDMRGLEPMPSIPALPAAAPSFAERLSTDGRPHTAPSQTTTMTAQETTAPNFTAAAQSPPQRGNRFASPRYGSPSRSSDGRVNNRPLAPPLPLVLRPPLRKKKSFSRVSNWLFNPDEKGAGSSADGATPSSPTMTFPSTTTTTHTHATTSPRPVKESDGFYQCVAPPEGLPRTSMETSSSVYTWETGGDDDDREGSASGSGSDEGSSNGEAKTVPTTTATTATTWSPDQTPKQASSTRHTTPVIGFERVGFEKETGMALGVGAGTSEGDGLGVVVDSKQNGHRPLSVGVAF
ncbi:hypothetical protein C7999DRAFT_15330 [Corynascus novoguineensis]|uniref:Uncharacterized protein n=1 Tax=Corynascus novoguineensis TaxID=1126955 RepID=A0AAN7CQP9_9PEZI|nr:hypothetical protein C7999DRAFT_15330 [Corynascus novoguineensis]